MLRIWGRRDAFNVQKAMWLIGELGLPHQHTPAGGSAGGHLSSLAALTPAD